MSRASSCLALACALLGCSDRTQLIVVVDSDLEVTRELDEVRVTVVGPSGMSAEASQALGQAEGPGLPLTLGVRPSGEALGPVTVTAEGRAAGALVVGRVATTSLVRGEARVLYLFLARDCRGVSCPSGQTCTENGCAAAQIDPEDLPPWTGEVPRRDAGAPDGGAGDGGQGDGGMDGGPPVACTTGSDCDDGIDCTVGICTDGVCSQRPDDGICTAAPDGVCDPTDGCQYAECTPAICTAGPCQTAMCVGDRCERTNLCAAGQACCAGACAPIGCSDGNPCTDDACGASGCENVHNSVPCDDGVFCNGADTCSGGSCAAHAGAPCSGSAVCDETMDVCTGCLMDTDCGGAVYGSWSGCGGFDDTCDETGTESRSVTTFTCSSGTCVPSTSSESRGCPRDTDGTSCGGTDCGGYGGCGGFSDTCDESGTESRTCTDYVCADGSCRGFDRSETRGCSRMTGGTSCGAGTSCGSWGACEGFDDPCDQTGTQSRSCTDYTCGGGTCNGGAERSEVTGCTRDTNGSSCDDGLWCTDGDSCSGGFCYGGIDLCGGGCWCDPSIGGCWDGGGGTFCPL